jgi:hypothetical protein
MCQFKPLENHEENGQQGNESSVKLRLDLKKVLIECIQ